MRAFTEEENMAYEACQQGAHVEYERPDWLPNLDAIDGLVAVYDSDDRLVAANARFYREEEFAPDVLKPGTPRADIVRAFLTRGRLKVEDPAERERRFNELMRRGATGNSRFQAVGYDGASRTVTYIPLVGGAVMAVQTAEATDDVSSRQPLEDSLFDVIDGIRESVTYYDADDRFVYANHQAEKDFEAIADVMVPGAHLAEILYAIANSGPAKVDPTEIDAWVESRLTAHRSEFGSSIAQMRDGRWLSVNRYRAKSGGVLVVRSDVSALKEAEHRLQRGDEALRAIVNTLDDRVLLADRQGRAIVVNHAMAAYLGRDADSLIGERPSDYMSEMQRTKRNEIFEHVAETKKPHIFEEVDGTRWFEISVFPVLNDEGDVQSFATIAHDVTARKRFTESLAKAKATAEQANNVKSEFLANMSHEFRTPLNAIIGFSDALTDGLFGPLANDRQSEYLNGIQVSGQHLLHLINAVLDVSAIEAGELELRESTFDLSSVVEGALTMARPRADSLGVRLIDATGGARVKIFADEMRVRQVLVNLLSNGAKFSESGSEVTVRRKFDDDGALRLSVIDHGIGMSEDDIEMAMMRFGRSDATVAREREGTGLGLPLSRALIEAHDGILTISSELGLGTVVDIVLPACRIRS